jgi:hypothetical protein
LDEERAAEAAWPDCHPARTWDNTRAASFASVGAVTKYTLAEALHVRAEDVQKWIDRGWLQCRTVLTGRLTRQIIEADAFCTFCKQHPSEILGRRLNSDRLSFVQTFVFPPSHMELLPVRESKKERAAYEEQMKQDAATSDDGERDEDDNWGMSA